MSLEQIKLAIAELPKDEFWELAKWFEEYQAELWDKEIEDDVAAGRLDWILDEVREEIQTSR